MLYPPVPYPPVVSSTPARALQHPTHPRGGLDDGEKQTTTDTTAARRTFRSPFKSPLIPRAFLPSHQASSASQPSSSQPQVAKAPPRRSPSVAAAPATPAKKRIVRPYVPFKSPARPASSAPSAAASTAVEISQMERKVAHLRQARRYQQATQRGDKDGDGELERLCAKWMEAGKLAAEMLFERVGSPDLAGDSAFSTSFSSPFSPSSWGFSSDAASSAHPSSDGWSSTWGFASSPPTSDPFGPSSHGFLSSSRRLTTADTVDRFKHTLAEEAKRRGTTQKALLSQMEEAQAEEPGGGELEEPEEAIARLLRRKKRPAKDGKSKEGEGKKVKREEEEEQDDFATDQDEASDDELLDALDSLIGDSSTARGGGGIGSDDFPPDDAFEEASAQVDVDDEADDLDAKALQEDWTVGKLLKSVGVDPALFGWSEELEGFE